MKTKIFLRLSVVMMSIALCMGSCVKSPVTDDGGGDDTGNGGNDGGDGGNGGEPSTELVVQLGWTGEITGIGDNPSDLVYIQAYTIPEDDDEYEKLPYAHGLFDHSSGIEISLQKDVKYKFYATIVPDGKNRIAMDGDGLYGLPFNTQLTNGFVVDGEFDSYYVMEGDASLAGSEIFYRPDIDRYYGESEVCTFTSENPDPVAINIIRATFGLNVKVNNLTEGKLNVEVEGSPKMSVSYPGTDISYIFSSAYPGGAYNVDGKGKTVPSKEYTETIYVKVTYESDSGTEVPVKQESYEFRRTEYTNLEITLSGKISEPGFDITVEENEMEYDGNEIEFVGGGDYIKN